MIKVMLVDDHRLVRAGLKRVLSELSDMEVVAEAGTGEEALELAKTHQPDVVLMDVSMPGIGGLDATRRLVQRYPSMKIIAVTMHTEAPYPNRLIAAGAAGYIGKDSAADEVAAAIRRVHAGGNYVAADIAGALATNLIQGKNQSPFELLSQRETQVMLMVTQGLSNQEISDRLCLSPKTVSTYRYRLFEKLGVGNDVELTKMAIRHGLLDDQKKS